MFVSKDILSHAHVLWNYHLMKKELSKSDFILLLGSHDTRPAEHAAKIFKEGFCDFIVCSGGYGKITKNTWHQTEAEHFAKILIDLEIPSSKIFIEKESTNTGDNFLLSKSLLNKKKISVKSGIIVTKPYMCRRAYATGAKQWPNISWQTSAPELSFENYPNDEVSIEKTINLMIGDLQRIHVYPKKGFQIKQSIPKNVIDSYNFLVRNGFNDYIIPNENF